MIPLRLSEIATLAGGQVAIRADGAGDGSVVVQGPAFLDSRAPEPGGLFVAFAGERVDGHTFAAAAVRADGAAAVLGSRPTEVPTVVVPDVRAALGRLAHGVLLRLDCSVLALTGSQGKTGTKDLLAQVLATAGPTVATRGNFNNEIGVPLTVLRAHQDTTHLVVEMGARGIGHIAELCQVAAPRIAAVLNVGTAHVGEFGSREAIAQAKGEIIEALPAEGFAVLNADDELVAAMATRTRATVITFGGTPGADLAWTDIALDNLGRPSATYHWRGDQARVQLQEVGEHQLANAGAAAAMALVQGLTLPQAAAALSTARSQSRWRMETTERSDGVVVINDAYNANPASMRAALGAAAKVAGARGGRLVAVLGQMRELGADAEDDHREIGAYAAELSTALLVVVGAEARALAQGASATAGWRGEALLTAGHDAATRAVVKNVRAGDVVLVKASRGVALEHVAEALLADHNATREDPAR